MRGAQPCEGLWWSPQPPLWGRGGGCEGSLRAVGAPHGVWGQPEVCGGTKGGRAAPWGCHHMGTDSLRVSVLSGCQGLGVLRGCAATQGRSGEVWGGQSLGVMGLLGTAAHVPAASAAFRNASGMWGRAQLQSRSPVQEGPQPCEWLSTKLRAL